jgi:excisionase family DNA binding protein
MTRPPRKSENRSHIELPPLPPVYLPRDIAKALHCSEWWVKEQARKGRIPFSKVGGSYRFSADHFDEIMRIFEKRPVEPLNVAADLVPVPRRPTQTKPAESVAKLTARTPRRAQKSPRSAAA